MSDRRFQIVAKELAGAKVVDKDRALPRSSQEIHHDEGSYFIDSGIRAVDRCRGR
jgi:hypothetical protein